MVVDLNWRLYDTDSGRILLLNRQSIASILVAHIGLKFLELARADQNLLVRVKFNTPLRKSAEN